MKSNCESLVHALRLCLTFHDHRVCSPLYCRRATNPRVHEQGIQYVIQSEKSLCYQTLTPRVHAATTTSGCTSKEVKVENTSFNQQNQCSHTESSYYTLQATVHQSQRPSHTLSVAIGIERKWRGTIQQYPLRMTKKKRCLL